MLLLLFFKGLFSFQINMEELLSLKWNNHRSTFLHILGVLRDKVSVAIFVVIVSLSFVFIHDLLYTILTLKQSFFHMAAALK